MQTTVLVTSLVGMGIVAWFFISAVRSSGTSAQASPTTEGRRAGLIWGMLLLGAVVTVASLWNWPHDVRADSTPITINVTGAQWSWEIDKTEVLAGRTVVFNVHSRDVNHGMGVVDPSGTLLFQTQSMPGYVNRVRYTFKKPGTYRVLCLEFCGVAHHDMRGEFVVVAKSN